MLDTEDEVNQKIEHLIPTMSDIAIHVVDVEEANDLMCNAVKFFDKYKDRGSFGDASLIAPISWFIEIYLSL